MNKITIKRRVKKAVKYTVPYGVVRLYQHKKTRTDNNYCPICEQESIFDPMFSAGIRRRQRACCPNCGSLERHRLTWLFIKRRIGLENITNKQSMLHVAAETLFEQRFRERIGKKYLTADMYEESADVKMDITNIKYPDETFDIIMCNHVLEHIVDDTQAMKELYRVQKEGGWAILLVPIADESKTYEDKSITSKKGRLEAFGQSDHVRKYGLDYAERLKSVGYKLKIYKAKDIATRQEIKRMSLKEDVKSVGFLSTDIYFCRK